jgi:hypothetical protein
MVHRFFFFSSASSPCRRRLLQSVQFQVTDPDESRHSAPKRGNIRAKWIWMQNTPQSGETSVIGDASHRFDHGARTPKHLFT